MSYDVHLGAPFNLIRFTSSFADFEKIHPSYFKPIRIFRYTEDKMFICLSTEVSIATSTIARFVSAVCIAANLTGVYGSSSATHF